MVSPEPAGRSKVGRPDAAERPAQQRAMMRFKLFRSFLNSSTLVLGALPLFLVHFDDESYLLDGIVQSCRFDVIRRGRHKRM
jgi:hypothetical protein